MKLKRYFSMYTAITYMNEIRPIIEMGLASYNQKAGTPPPGCLPIAVHFFNACFCPFTSMISTVVAVSFMSFAWILDSFFVFPFSKL